MGGWLLRRRTTTTTTTTSRTRGCVRQLSPTRPWPLPPLLLLCACGLVIAVGAALFGHAWGDAWGHARGHGGGGESGALVLLLGRPSSGTAGASPAAASAPGASPVGAAADSRRVGWPLRMALASLGGWLLLALMSPVATEGGGGGRGDDATASSHAAPSAGAGALRGPAVGLGADGLGRKSDKLHATAGKAVGKAVGKVAGGGGPKAGVSPLGSVAATPSSLSVAAAAEARGRRTQFLAELSVDRRL